MGALSPATSYRQLIRDEKISPSDNFFFESNYSPSSPSVDWWRLSSRRDVIMTAILNIGGECFPVGSRQRNIILTISKTS